MSTIFTVSDRIIGDGLKKRLVPCPTKETWDENAEKFALLWQFPLCLGAIDGKHVLIKVSVIFDIIVFFGHEIKKNGDSFI